MQNPPPLPGARNTTCNKQNLRAVNAKTEFASINGRKIAYRSVGDGDPLILCLRFRGNLDSWDPAFIDTLAEKSRVITFDYRGFGLSTGNPPDTMKGFAEDVKDLAEFLGLEKFVVVGWSFGGGVAQIVASEMPELVSAAVLIGTRPPGSFMQGPAQTFVEISAKQHNDFADEIILFFNPTSELSKKKALESHDRIAARTNDNDIYIQKELWPHYFMAFQDFANDPYDARQKLAGTEIPVLVITSDNEIVFPAENWFALNWTWRTTQIITIPQAGHAPHHQHPEMIAGYILMFINNIEHLTQSQRIDQ